MVVFKTEFRHSDLMALGTKFKPHDAERRGRHSQIEFGNERKLGSIHQALGEVDKALEFFELEVDLFKELYESNPKNVELKNGLAVSYYKLGGIVQNKQQTQAMYTQAIALWQELYDLTQLETYKGYIEHTKELL
jgi:tetratricopeptide (TPR) repeat protein